MQAAIKELMKQMAAADEMAVLSACNELIPFIHAQGLKHGVKFFDNYNYRTIAMNTEVKKGPFEDCILNKKRTGPDATSEKHGLKDIEFKTSNDDKDGNKLKASFMWDKQSEEKRRKETLESDAFVLGRFVNEKLQVILVGKEEKTLDHVRGLMKKKQEAFIAHWNENIKQGKRGGSDAIRLSYEDLLVGDSSSEVIWDLWLQGEWHMAMNSKTCLETMLA